MPDIDPRTAIRLRLRTLSLENYRKARWRAIDDARNEGMTWPEIGEVIDMEQSAVRRVWLKDAPQ